MVCLFVFWIVFWKLFYVRNVFKFWRLVELSRKWGSGGVIFVVNLLVVGLETVRHGVGLRLLVFSWLVIPLGFVPGRSCGGGVVLSSVGLLVTL